MSSTAVEKTLDEQNQEQLLETLATLGGQRVQEDALRFEGTEIVLPATMTAPEAVKFLEEWQQAQENETVFDRRFRYRPHDGAHALQSAMRRVFGTSGIQRPEWAFWGRRPPRQIDIAIGYEETTQVFTGQVSVPIFNGTMTLGTWESPKFGQLFRLFIECPKKFAPHAEAIFELVEQELRTNSIYRGKAIDGDEEPNFIDLNTVDPERVIYSEAAQAQLEANIWSLMRRTQIMRDLRLPLKRAILLHGPYGTGKTLAAYRTAQIATEFNWTFIYCRPAEDDLPTVLATAKLYTPAIVFVEDLDSIEKRAGKQDAVEVLLDAFDGITTKGSEVMMVLTTNHPENINKAMLRPGRLDAVIEIGSLDQSGVMRMIESLVPVESRQPDLDYEAIHAAMEGFLPAFVKEATDRAIRYALARGEDEFILDTEDFVRAAEGLKPQLRMMQEATEPRQPPRLEQQLESVVRNAMDGAHGEQDGDHIFDLKV